MGSEIVDSRRFASYWRDVAWQSSGASLAQLVGIAGMPVLTRLYTPEDFAVQSLFLQVVTYATALVTWRYEYFVQLPRSEEDVRSLNKLVLVLGFISVIVFTPLLWIFRDAAAAQLGNSDVGPWLFLAPSSAALFSWAVAAQNNAQRRADFRTSGLSELVGKLAYVATGVVGALMYSGAVGLIITTAIAAIGKLGYVFLRRPTRASAPLQTDVGAVQRIRKYYGRLATATVVAHIMSTSALAIPQVAIARLYGAVTLGQFALVLATIFIPSGLVSAAVGNVYYQRAANQWAEGQTFLLLWRDTVRKLALIGVPVYAAAVLFSKVAYPFIFGDQWQAAGEYATWMAMGAFVQFVSAPMDRTCLIVGAASYSLIWGCCRLLLTLVLVWLAWTFGFSPSTFIIVLVVQMSVGWGIDLWMGYRFSQGRVRIFARGQ
jgi:O-antigen/teichoic acid export membrane protein